ncbi:MAG: glutathione peroxidase [Fimbriimonadaceae bacterium]
MTAALLALFVNTSFYDFKMNDIGGKPVQFAKYKGKVTLVVNVASQCGLTPQYEGLQALYVKYKDKGLTVFGFPANEFRGQEPGTNSEIKEFCTAKYGVTFPMFEKSVVKGDGINPIYKWLLENGPRKDDIEWNFAKFLIGKNGEILGRFEPKIKPDDAALIAAIEKALSATS